MAGIDVRLRRIFGEDGKAVICPLDFGGFMGPVKGLYDPSAAVRKVVEGGCDAILVNPGLAATEWESFAGKTGLVVRVTGGSTKFSPNPAFHTLVCSVEEACRLGADAICIMLLVGSDYEQEMFEIMGQVVSEAHVLGIPVLAEVIPCDPAHSFDPEWISVCARVGSGSYGVEFARANSSARTCGEPCSHWVRRSGLPQPTENSSYIVGKGSMLAGS